MSYPQQVRERIAFIRSELDALARAVEALDGPAAQSEPTSPDVAPTIAPEATQAAPVAAVAVTPTPAPVRATPDRRPAVIRRPKATPVEPGTIGPKEAAAFLGVVRATVDRRLKDVDPTTPGAPTNTTPQSVRARWRWNTEADVRAWWAAVS